MGRPSARSGGQPRTSVIDEEMKVTSPAASTRQVMSAPACTRERKRCSSCRVSSRSLKATAVRASSSSPSAWDENLSADRADHRPSAAASRTSEAMARSCAESRRSRLPTTRCASHQLPAASSRPAITHAMKNNGESTCTAGTPSSTEKNGKMIPMITPSRAIATASLAKTP